MPRTTLQIVAALIVACAVGGFVMGFQGAPGRSRLPGEDAAGVGAPIAAAEYMPLDQSALAPPEPEPAPEAEAEKKDEPVEVAEAPPPKAPEPAAPAPAAQPAGEDKVGDLLDAVAPPPEAPIF